MWNNHHCGCNQVSPAYDMGNHHYCGSHGNYNNSSFVLIVVLFILLIIVGSVYCF